MNAKRKFYNIVARILDANLKLLSSLTSVSGFEKQADDWEAIANIHRRALAELELGKPLEGVRKRWKCAIDDATSKG